MDGSVTSNEKVVKKNREEKLIEQKIENDLKKVLSTIDDPNQKNQVLMKRCVEIERKLKIALQEQKNNQKIVHDLLKDKDNLQSEYSRVINTKSKLESLCRELQNQNKSIKEESLSKIKEEEESRKATQARFQQSLAEIQKLMNENAEKNKKLETDNTEMSQKFKQILTQYEDREKQMDRINKQMELVTQLNEAKLAKAGVEQLAERENFLKQTNILEETINILKKQLSEALGSEKNLRAQVELYSSKYSEFTKTFDGYKTDMTKMTKKTFKMEKEMLQWKIKYEKANAMLLDLLSEKQVRDEHITKTAKQLFHLQKLCRQLSAEKKSYYNKLVECNIEIPVVDIKDEPQVLPAQDLEAPTEQEKGPDKLDVMLRNRDDLKENLAQLQGQLSELNVSESSKKSKAKKSKKGGKNPTIEKAAVDEIQEPKSNGDASVAVTIENSDQCENEEVSVP